MWSIFTSYDLIKQKTNKHTRPRSFPKPNQSFLGPKLNRAGTVLRWPWGLVAWRRDTLQYLRLLLLESFPKLFYLSCMRVCWYKRDPWPEDQKPHKWSRAEQIEKKLNLENFLISCKMQTPNSNEWLWDADTTRPLTYGPREMLLHDNLSRVKRVGNHKQTKLLSNTKIRYSISFT